VNVTSLTRHLKNALQNKAVLKYPITLIKEVLRPQNGAERHLQRQSHWAISLAQCDGDRLQRFAGGTTMSKSWFLLPELHLGRRHGTDNGQAIEQELSWPKLTLWRHHSG